MVNLRFLRVHSTFLEVNPPLDPWTRAKSSNFWSKIPAHRSQDLEDDCELDVQTRERLRKLPRNAIEVPMVLRLRCFLLHGTWPWAMEDGLPMVLAKRVSWKLCIPKTYTHIRIIYIYIYTCSHTYYILYTSSTAQGGGGSFKNTKPRRAWLL